MSSEKSSWYAIFLIIFFISSVQTAGASEPLWTHSCQGNKIEGLSVTSDGSAVAVAAGKIWLFTKNGTLLTKEPFGEQVVFTPDGSILVSSYSDTIFLFNRKTLLKESESPLQKKWEATMPGTVHSIDVSDNGKTVVASLIEAGLYIYDSAGKMTGAGKSHTSVVRISSTGSHIVGVSLGVLCLFNGNAECSGSEEGVVGEMPDFMELTGSGEVAVFNDGPRVRSVFVDNRTLRWIKSAGGDVTSLAMTPSGSFILAGMKNGNTSLFDQNGNITWRYTSNPGNNEDAEITCVALSKDGVVAAAGTYDGQIYALNSKGEVIFSNRTEDHIRHIDMSADGSLIVATGDSMVYAFSTSRRSLSTVRTTISSTTLARPQSVDSVPEQSLTQEPIKREITSDKNTEVPTLFSVIRTSTQSSLSGILTLAGLLTALFIAAWRR